jgi:hypothetical protein
MNVMDTMREAMRAQAMTMGRLCRNSPWLPVSSNSGR